MYPQKKKKKKKSIPPNQELEEIKGEIHLLDDGGRPGGRLEERRG
jgi:hypothetical protein